MSVIGSVRGVARQMALVELCLVMGAVTHSAQTIFTRSDFLTKGVLFDLTKGAISIRIVCV